MTQEREWRLFQSSSFAVLIRSDAHEVRLEEAARDTMLSTNLFFEMINFYKDGGEGWVKDACSDFDDFLKRERAMVCVISNKELMHDNVRFSVIQHNGKCSLLLVLHPQFHVSFSLQNKKEVVHDVLSTVQQAVDKLKQLEQEGIEFLTIGEVQEQLRSVTTSGS